MTAAHKDIIPRGFSYEPDESKTKNLNNDKIKRIIKRSKDIDKRKNFFDSIIENFFSL